jgi:hypothetical protein
MKFRKSSLLLAAVALVVMQLPAAARVQIEDSITIDADMQTVWQALKDYQREQKMFDKKIVAEKGDDTTIKEEFIKVPVVGSATLSYVESRKGNYRIDYWLTGSKILNVFKGSWQLSKNEKGGTTIKLTTDVDSWMPVPMKNKLLRNHTAAGMKKRLSYVKAHAEKLSQQSAQLSQTGNKSM